MRLLASTLARIALIPATMMMAPALADDVPTHALWQFQWALENTDTSQGVCVTVPWSGACEHDTVLPVADIDINALHAWPDTGLMAATPAVTQSNATPPVVIGLIDTGIDYRHPDLTRHIWRNAGEITGTDLDGNSIDDGCEDSIDGDDNGYLNDCHGINTLASATLTDGTPNPAAGDPMDSALAHGTHMAGLMVGDSGFNGMGIRGVAGNANAKVVTCKAGQMEQVLEYVPGTAVPALTQARMKQCVDYFIALRERGENLRIINASGGMSAFINLGFMWASVKPLYLLDSVIFEPLLAKLRALDVLVVAAAGNMAWDMDTRFDERGYFPAAFASDNVLSVTAINAQGNVWDYSTYGRYSVDVAAPGQHILSAAPDGDGNQETMNYGIASGTSPATALVSGLAALLKATPTTADLTAQQLRHLIMASGRPLASLSEKTLSGRSIRISDTNGQGAFSCENQIVQRRLLPRSKTVTLLTGDTLHLEIESFNCADISSGPIVATSPQGITLHLLDDGRGADQVANDGIFTVEWQIPALPTDRYEFTYSQGTALPDETLTVATTVIADNANVSSSVKGTWWGSTLRPGYWATGYTIAYTSSSERRFMWNPVLPRNGRYALMVRWPVATAFASNAGFFFNDGNGTAQGFTLNQKEGGGQWVSLGEFNFNAGPTTFTLSNAGADGTVVADAIQLVWKAY